MVGIIRRALADSRGESIDIKKWNTDTLICASKEAGPEANAGRSVLLFRHKNAGQIVTFRELIDPLKI